jgi:hypothetical protein
MEHIWSGDTRQEVQALPARVVVVPGRTETAHWRFKRRAVPVMGGGLHSPAGLREFLKLRKQQGAPLVGVAAALAMSVAELVFVTQTAAGERAATLPIYEWSVDPHTGVGRVTLPRAALSANALRLARLRAPPGSPLQFARRALFPEWMTPDPDALARLLTELYPRSRSLRSEQAGVELNEVRVDPPRGDASEGQAPFIARIATDPDGGLLSAYPLIDHRGLFYPLPDPTWASILSALQTVKVLQTVKAPQTGRVKAAQAISGLPAELRKLPEELNLRIRQAMAVLVGELVRAGQALVPALAVDTATTYWRERSARKVARMGLAPLLAMAANGRTAAPEAWCEAVERCAGALPLRIDATAAIPLLQHAIILADLSVGEYWGPVAGISAAGDRPPKEGSQSTVRGRR